jgi:small subunit ribosomal protein S8
MSFQNTNTLVCKLLAGQQSLKKYFVCPITNNNLKLVILLKKIGFIVGFNLFTFFNQRFIKVFLKHKHKSSVLKNIRVVSRPSKKIYLQLDSIIKFNPNGGILILHTNKGVLTHEQCKNLNVGGEPILFIC